MHSRGMYTTGMLSLTTCGTNSSTGCCGRERFRQSGMPNLALDGNTHGDKDVGQLDEAPKIVPRSTLLLLAFVDKIGADCRLAAR